MSVSREKGLHLYIMQSDVTGAVKIGRSSEPDKRRKDLQTGSPYHIRILAVILDKGSEEHKVHMGVERWRLRGGTEGIKGEWFHHDCLPNLPDWIYEKLPFEDSWWQSGR